MQLLCGCKKNPGLNDYLILAAQSDHTTLPYAHPHSHGSHGDGSAVPPGGANNTFVINLGPGVYRY